MITHRSNEIQILLILFCFIFVQFICVLQVGFDSIFNFNTKNQGESMQSLLINQTKWMADDEKIQSHGKIMWIHETSSIYIYIKNNQRLQLIYHI